MKFKKSSSTVNISTRKSIIPLIGMAILSIVLLGATYIGLGHVFETETYYVLKADVPAKTLVTQEMVEAKEVSKGGAPNNSIRIDNIKKGEVYTSIPLLKGDVLSASNTGINVNSDALGIPDSWSVTTFDINEGDASGGNIQKGDYFDIIGIDDKNEAKYLYTDVLALKLGTTKPQTTVSEKGQTVEQGEQLQYTIGMPPKEIARFHSALKEYKHIKIVLSPREVKYQDRKFDDLDKKFLGSASNFVDLKKGTDPTFAPVARDKDGRPLKQEDAEKSKDNDKKDDKKEEKK